MSIFHLLVYSCVTINSPLTGDLVQKTCNWNQTGGPYATREACLRASPPLRSPVLSDVADGRTVEAIKCNEQSVIQ